MYRCNSHRQEYQHQSVNITERKLERKLFEYVDKALENTIIEVQAIEQTRKVKKPKSNQEAINRKLEKLDDLYINSDHMTRDQYDKRREEILAQLIEEEPEEQHADVATLQSMRDLLSGTAGDIYNSFTEEEKRVFWRGILNSVTLAPGGQIVDIDFKA